MFQNKSLIGVSDGKKGKRGNFQIDSGWEFSKIIKRHVSSDSGNVTSRINKTKSILARP